MANDYLTRGVIVALVVLTVAGMTAAPAMANSTPNHGNGDDCDLVDVDGDDNSVSVDMQNSDVNINCGDDGAAGGGADDAGDAADEDMTVQVNGEEVDTSGQQQQQQQDGQDGADGQDGQDGADGQDGQDGADGQDGQQQQQQQDDGQQQQQQQQQEQQQDTDVDVDVDGDDGAEEPPADDEEPPADDEQPPADGQDGGDDTAETGDSDNEQNVEDVDNSTILQLLLDKDFIDQSEVNAAINNENISNSTIVNNIVNGDQTINRTSVFVDNSVTNIDNSTRIVVNNNGTITIINEDGPGDVVTPPGDDGGNETPPGDGNETPPGDGNETPPGDGNMTDGNLTGISVTKSAGNAILDPDAGANVTVDFTVTVTNNGNETAEDVVVQDEMPLLNNTDLADLETSAIVLVDASSDNGNYDAGTGNFTVGSLAPGESAELTLTTAVVNVGDSEVNNTATLLTDDTTPGNNVGTVEFETLVGVITEPLADAFEETLGVELDPVLDALGIQDLTTFLEDEILAGNLDLGEAVDSIDQGPQAIISILETLTGNDFTGGLPGDGTPGLQQVSAASASGGIPLSGMAVGTMGVVGLLGSVLVFRRKDE